MNTTDIELIKTNIRGQLEDKTVAPLFISGSVGVGKSSTLAAIAKELNMGLLDISAPALTIELLNGLPDEIDANHLAKSEIVQSGTNVQLTKWTIPEIIAAANTMAEKQDTILLLDDFHMVAPHLQAYFFKLLLQRALGNYKLYDNVVILGTLNDSDSAGFQGINAAVRNRMMIHPVKFDFDWWFENWGRKNLDYRVASFLRDKPQYAVEEETTEIEGAASPRVWSSISASLAFMDKDFVTKHAREIAGSQVSSTAANAFAKHVAYINAINFEKVINDKDIVDMSKRDPLDSIIFSYIVNFVDTIKHGEYVLKLLDKNVDDKSFVGFTIGELYRKYLQMEETGKISKGVKFVIDILLCKELDRKEYDGVTDKEWKKMQSFEIQNKETLLNIGAKYIV